MSAGSSVQNSGTIEGVAPQLLGLQQAGLRLEEVGQPGPGQRFTRGHRTNRTTPASATRVTNTVASTATTTSRPLRFTSDRRCTLAPMPNRAAPSAVDCTVPIQPSAFDGTTPVVRTTAQATKPSTNSGTSGGRRAATVEGRRRMRFAVATTGASSSTRVSLTTTAVASTAAPAPLAVATTWPTSCTL